MDIFIFSTVWDLEGFGVVLPEAMSYKIPVIGSQFGPVPEIIEDGITGVLVPPADAKALAKTLIDLYKNPEKRKILSENAYKKAVTGYNIQVIAQNFLKIFYIAYYSNG